jgi:hypothetical protein
VTEGPTWRVVGQWLVYIGFLAALSWVAYLAGMTMGEWLVVSILSGFRAGVTAQHLD